MQKLINKRSIVIDYLMMIVGTGLLAQPSSVCMIRSVLSQEVLQDLRL